MENSHLLSGFWIPEQVWSLEPILICTGTPSPPQSAHLFYFHSSSLSYLFLPSFLIFPLGCAACGILVPCPGVEPTLTSGESRVLTTGQSGNARFCPFILASPARVLL